MAKRIPLLNIQLDTFQSWVSRTNELITILSTEVVTANSSGGITGSALAPVSARLFGSFESNTLVASGSFTANANTVDVNGTKLTISGSKGTSGQVLTSNGTVAFWANSSATAGGVTSIVTGPGLSGGPITSSGSIQVRANSGVIANTSGLFTDDNYIRQMIGQGTSVSELQGFTWAAPAGIGTQTANTGTFTVATASTSYRLGSTTVISNTAITSLGSVVSKTINSAAGLILRARDDNAFATFQVTSAAGDSQWNLLTVTPERWSLSSDLSILNGIEVGYRNIPQEPANADGNILASSMGGRHLYKTTGSAITLALLDNSAQPSPIGTAITIVNDASSGNIAVSQSGATVIQLAGTVNTGNRIISPGGVATFLKVQTNKWIASGAGVS
jgi:hypothetical protein